MELVSVIIPTYNRADMISGAIFSALNQTYSNLEIIIVDDASTDNTSDIISEIRQENARIHYVRLEENAGAANAINQGLKKVSGSFIAFLDSDDEWVSDKIEKQIYLLRSSSSAVGLVGCNAFLMNESGKILGEYKTKIKFAGYPHLLRKNYLLSNSSIMIKKELIEVVGERDSKIKIIYDWDYWLRSLVKGYMVAVVNEPLLKYRIHNQSLSRGSKDNLYLKEFLYLLEKHKELYMSNKKQYGKALLYICEIYLLGGDRKSAARTVKLASKIFPVNFMNLFYAVFVAFGCRSFKRYYSLKLILTKGYLGM